MMSAVVLPLSRGNVVCLCCSGRGRGHGSCSLLLTSIMLMNGM